MIAHFDFPTLIPPVGLQWCQSAVADISEFFIFIHFSRFCFRFFFTFLCSEPANNHGFVLIEPNMVIFCWSLIDWFFTTRVIPFHTLPK